MDIDERKIGEWPNVALVPGTHIHAATGKYVEQPENTRIGRSRGADGPETAGPEPALDVFPHAVGGAGNRGGLMYEKCRRCGSEPTLANYYDFYRLHCPTPGCREHLSDYILSGKGKWYGSIDEARDAWNARQKQGEAANANETAKPESEPAGAGSGVQDGSKRKTKRQLRAEAVERLRETGLDTGGAVKQLAKAIGSPWEPPRVNWCLGALKAKLIELLTDDEPEITTMYEPTDDAPPVKLARLLNCLERDYGIKASWDGLRRVWLTERAEPLPVDNTQADSRKRLEAEVMATVRNLVKYCDVHPVLFEKAKSWLDRQAAITAREVSDSYEHKAERQSDRIFELHNKLADALEQVDNLTAERDKLDEMRERYARALNQIADALGIEITDDAETHAKEMEAIEKLTAERDRMQRVIETQRDSFAKIEHQVNTLRASVAGLKDTLEERNARIEMLQDENAELCMQVHGAPF